MGGVQYLPSLPEAPNRNPIGLPIDPHPRIVTQKIWSVPVSKTCQSGPILTTTPDRFWRLRTENVTENETCICNMRYAMTRIALGARIPLSTCKPREVSDLV